MTFYLLSNPTPLVIFTPNIHIHVPLALSHFTFLLSARSIIYEARALRRLICMGRYFILLTKAWPTDITLDSDIAIIGRNAFRKDRIKKRRRVVSSTKEAHSASWYNHST